MNRRVSVTQRYHEATKYSEESMTRNTHELDFAKQPNPYKEYAGKDRVWLGQFLPIQPNIFKPKTQDYNPLVQEPDNYPRLAALSRLLFASSGITAFVPTMDGKHALRASPSAGALYPTEIYVAIRNMPDVPDGIYNYQVFNHSLALHWEGDFWEAFESACFGHESVTRGDFVLLLTGVWYRSSWRYQDRAYRRVLLDTGHVYGNIHAFARQEGWTACPIGGFDDSALQDTLFLNEQQEGSLMVVPLVPDAGMDASIRRGSVYRSKADSVLRGHGIVDMHMAGYLSGEEEHAPATLDMTSLETPHAGRREFRLPSAQPPWQASLFEVILRRRSARAFQPAPCEKTQLSAVLKYAYAPLQEIADGSRPSPLLDPTLVETYVVALRVNDIPPGLYYYAPLSHALRQIRAGEFTMDTWHFCLRQELCRDCAAVVVHATRLEDAVEQYGDRAYRYQHLDAGHIGQRLNLAAVGYGLGASGIGGFFDDEINDLLGLGPTYMIDYVTTLGVPRTSQT